MMPECAALEEKPRPVGRQKGEQACPADALGKLQLGAVLWEVLLLKLGGIQENLNVRQPDMSNRDDRLQPTTWN